MRQVANVLVIVLLLVVGAGLAAVGVLKGRTEAARLQCTNNVRVIGHGVVNELGTQGAFPAATLSQDHLYPEDRLSWFVDVLAYIEQTNLFVDRTKPWDAEENCPPKARSDDGRKDKPFGSVTFFFCPSNPHRVEP